MISTRLEQLINLFFPQTHLTILYLLYAKGNESVMWCNILFHALVWRPLESYRAERIPLHIFWKINQICSIKENKNDCTVKFVNYYDLFILFYLSSNSIASLCLCVRFCCCCVKHYFCLGLTHTVQKKNDCFLMTEKEW